MNIRIALCYMAKEHVWTKVLTKECIDAKKPHKVLTYRYYKYIFRCKRCGESKIEYKWTTT